MSIDGPNEPALHLCERELLGFGQPVVGAALACRWRLPASRAKRIAWSARPPIHPLAWEMTGLGREQALRVPASARRAVDAVKQPVELPGLH